MGSDTTMAGGMGSDTTMAGTGEMTMRPVEFIELKAGMPMEMKPGGYHIMMMGLVNPLKLGDTITVTLTLENAGEIKVDVPVLDEAP
jgi:copper(I)-binding protein